MIVTRRAALAVIAGAALPPGALAQARLSFESGGGSVTVERFDAAGGRRPAVVLLHGSDGAGSRYRAAARRLAAAGYHVFLPHYLERTGQSRASFATIPRHLPAWSETARDGIAFASRQAGVDPARVGLLGVSLGGGLALLAAQTEARVRAVATMFGFLPGSFDPEGRLPPTLVLHGARDRIVPVHAATQLEGLLQRRRIPHEVQIYSDQGHGFTGTAAEDAAARIVSFFRRHLGA